MYRLGNSIREEEEKRLVTGNQVDSFDSCYNQRFYQSWLQKQRLPTNPVLLIKLNLANDMIENVRDIGLEHIIVS